MAGEIPLLKTLNLTVSTENSFPHSTGIASSASGTSAFTLCLLDTVNQVTGQCISNDDLVHLASYAARMGSGSACRSLYGGYTAWGESEQLPASSDEFAIPVSSLVHPEMLTMQNAILVISAEPKEMPSTLGHKSMEDHPFLAGRIGQAEKNMNDALQALKTNDFEKLAAVAECEALTLHALMMSAHPGILLMKPATVESIHLIRKARKGGLSLFFTLDAGANVHVMYPRAAAEEVNKFICDALLPLCEDGKVIFDRCGNGPVKLTEPQHTP
jgi:diphosphomevalonate decarboxylase